MAILEVSEDDNRNLQNIANALAGAKKVVIITGAGISTNCGIPDFRSEEGLYSLMQAQYDIACSSDNSAVPHRASWNNIEHAQATIRPPQRSLPTSVKGKDLFDSQIWSDETSTAVFYRFISSLRENIRQDVRRTTPTHRFIRMMRDRRKLVRCYTQNIDGLENREGLSTDLGLGKGARQRFTKKSLESPLVPSRTRAGGDFDSGCEVVQLHGELETLRCTLCQQISPWDEQPAPNRSMLLSGSAPFCPQCRAADQDRQDRGKRGTKIGILRPNIVLYGEEHPSADELGSIMAHDLCLSPDVLLILGTSLHVHGLKTLVREFAKSVHAKPNGKGKVIFVNLSKPSDSVWKDVFDYWVPMDCDAWVGAMRKHRPDLFHVQEQLSLPTRKVVRAPLSKNLLKAYGESAIGTENMVINSDDSQRADKASKPQVVVPATPKKRKAPLQERKVEPVSARGVRVSCPDPLPYASADCPTPLSQLPTPTFASTSVSTRRRRRTLTENYNGMAQTPSKRRKLPVSIWTDVGAGA